MTDGTGEDWRIFFEKARAPSWARVLAGAQACVGWEKPQRFLASPTLKNVMNVVKEILMCALNILCGIHGAMIVIMLKIILPPIAIRSFLKRVSSLRKVSR